MCGNAGKATLARTATGPRRPLPFSQRPIIVKKPADRGDPFPERATSTEWLGTSLLSLTKRKKRKK